MTAVDPPRPGGITSTELGHPITALVAAPESVGMQVTVYDPDLDPDGEEAARLADCLITGILGLP